VTLILLAHPHDHVTIEDGAINVTFATPPQKGTVTIAPSLIQRLLPDQ
jgi:hypothetical protein